MSKKERKSMKNDKNSRTAVAEATHTPDTDTDTNDSNVAVEEYSTEAPAEDLESQQAESAVAAETAAEAEVAEETAAAVKASSIDCPHCHAAIPMETVMSLVGQQTMSVVSGKSSARQPRNVVYKLQGTFDQRKAKIADAPPQMRALVEIFEKAGTPEVSEEVAMKLIAENRDALRTKQDPWRIFQYYKARLNEKKIFLIS
jgi:hypothetical protein